MPSRWRRPSPIGAVAALAAVAGCLPGFGLADEWRAAAGKYCWSEGGVALGAAENGLGENGCRERCDATFGCNFVLHDARSGQCLLFDQPGHMSCDEGEYPGLTSSWRPPKACKDTGLNCHDLAAPGKCFIDSSIVDKCGATCGACPGSEAELVPWTWLTSGAGCTFELTRSECKVVAARLGSKWDEAGSSSDAEAIKSFGKATCFEDTFFHQVTFADRSGDACSSTKRCLCRSEKAAFDPASPSVSYSDEGGCGVRGPYAEACDGRKDAHEVSSVGFTGKPIARIGGCNYFAYSVYDCGSGGGVTQAPPAPAPPPKLASTSTAEATTTTPVPTVTGTSTTVTTTSTTTTTATTTTTTTPQAATLVGELLLSLSGGYGENGAAAAAAFMGDPEATKACASGIAEAAGVPTTSVVVKMAGDAPEVERRLLAGSRAHWAQGTSLTLAAQASQAGKVHLQYWVRLYRGEAGHPAQGPAIEALSNAQRMKSLIGAKLLESDTKGKGLSLSVLKASAPEVKKSWEAVEVFQDAAAPPPVQWLPMVLMGLGATAAIAAVVGAAFAIVSRRQRSNYMAMSGSDEVGYKAAFEMQEGDVDDNDVFAGNDEEAVAASSAPAAVDEEAAAPQAENQDPGAIGEAVEEDAHGQDDHGHSSVFHRLGLSHLTSWFSARKSTQRDLEVGADGNGVSAREGHLATPLLGAEEEAAPAELSHATSPEGSHLPAPAAQERRLTPEQAESVDMLCAMGFERPAAIRALEKNQWNAAEAAGLLAVSPDGGSEPDAAHPAEASQCSPAAASTPQQQGISEPVAEDLGAGGAEASGAGATAMDEEAPKAEQKADQGGFFERLGLSSFASWFSAPSAQAVPSPGDLEGGVEGHVETPLLGVEEGADADADAAPAALSRATSPERAAVAQAPVAQERLLTPEQAEGVDMLCAMGFERPAAIRALEKKQWDAAEAAELLMVSPDGGSEPEDAPLAETPPRGSASASPERPRSPAPAAAEASTPPRRSPPASAAAASPKLTSQQAQDLDGLCEMGFAREAALRSLQASDWNQAEAMELLFANPAGPSASASPPPTLPPSAAASPPPAAGRSPGFGVGASPGAASAASGGSRRLTPDQVAKVMNLTNMGFEREQAIEQLEADEWDLQRALNHILAA